MTENNNDLILEIIDIFVDQVEEFRSEMQIYFDKKDFDSLGKIAHKAKSSVAIVGMESMSKRLKELELLCQENKNTDSIKIIISEFKTECIDAVEELLEYKKNHI
jgi:HPt (histidine-containing phosphotransfer) domain-containing protein